MSTFPRRVGSKFLQTPSPSSTIVSQETAAGTLQPPRPVSETPFGAGLDFDAGINSSNAWTKFLENDTLRRTTTQLNRSLESEQNDEESVYSDPLAEVIGRPAIILYDFDGQDDLGELSVRSGDMLEVLREHVASEEGDASITDGWSLARARVRILVSGEDQETKEENENSAEDKVNVSIGLVPRSYYIVSQNAAEQHTLCFNNDMHQSSSLTNTLPCLQAGLLLRMIPLQMIH